jgi:peptidyl-dipeptidase A
MMRVLAASIAIVLVATSCARTPKKAPAKGEEPPAAQASVPPPAAPADPTPVPPAAQPQAASAGEARAFVKQVNDDLKRLNTEASRAEWIKNTYITHDTEILSADANEKLLGYMSEAIAKAARFDNVQVDEDTRRSLYLLKVSSPLASPSDPEKRKELAAIGSKLTSIYGRGKYCTKDKSGKETCKDLGELSDILGKSRNYEELLDAWRGWHQISVEMKPLYARFVELSNEGAREIGFKDSGQLWKAGYDMPPDQFEATTEKLWTQVKPLYDELHCYVRSKLVAKYGKTNVPEDGPIPAHLLGNMWAQEWGKIYDLVEPYKGAANLDVTKAMVSKKYDAIKMVKLGESFFTSLGMDPLPPTFWERSMFLQPKDRDVVCHASAWDVTYGGDIRIKMCIKVEEEDLITIHHELGHNYYYMYYYTLPILYQNGANDGFHEAIGDALALSVTPSYLQKIGILNAVPNNEKGLINLQMKDALEKIAFLPFGKLVDQWRWDVFTGKVTPAQYNSAWWELRKKYQGIAPASPRGEDLFDPGAKYHVPANVPYTRYFLARILQFQFHRALCQAAGHTGPLHTCSIYGNQAAGEKLKAMLKLGASRPWPDALEVLTGQREMDATALVEYFAPLRAWMQKEIAGKKCGW